MTDERDQITSRRLQGDGGAALVEFAFVAILLSLLVFGIINFGLMLSFKQDLTRAAAEGARAAAVEYPGSGAVAAASAATDEAVDDFDKACGADGLACTVSLHDCSDSVPDTNGNDPAIEDCVQVRLVYDYEAHPIVPPVPIIAQFLPDEVVASSDVRINE